MNSDKKQIAMVRRVLSVMEEARKQNEQYSWLIESLSPIDEAAPVTRIQEAPVIKNEAVKKTRADRERTKLEKQQAAIMEAIRAKDFNPLAIPDGEKGALKMICEADYPDLFDGATSFDNAWKASKALFRMANYASYSRRGKA